MNTYQQKAHDTKARRQAAGRYPTRHQKAAFSRYMQVGKRGLTAEECALLSTHPDLLPSQRHEFCKMAWAMGW